MEPMASATWPRRATAHRRPVPQRRTWPRGRCVVMLLVPATMQRCARALGRRVPVMASSPRALFVGPRPVVGATWPSTVPAAALRVPAMVSERASAGRLRAGAIRQRAVPAMGPHAPAIPERQLEPCAAAKQASATWPKSAMAECNAPATACSGQEHCAAGPLAYATCRTRAMAPVKDAPTSDTEAGSYVAAPQDRATFKSSAMAEWIAPVTALSAVVLHVAGAQGTATWTMHALAARRIVRTRA